MKRLLAILLIFSVIGVAVFGILAMGQMDEHGHGQCIASTAQGGLMPCPEEGASGVVSFHFNAFSKYSVAVFGRNMLALTLVWIALALISLLNGFRRLQFSGAIAKLMNIAAALHLLISALSKEHFLNWLALRENSPSPYLGRR